MERKKLSEKSFQYKIVDFLKQNHPMGFTAREILDEVNKDLEEPDKKKMGSISGTLAALFDSGWINKSDDYPAKFSYREDYSHISVDLGAADLSLKEASVRGKSSGGNISVADIKNEINDIKKKILSIDSQITNLQTERYGLQSQLELAERLLLRLNE